MDNGLIITEALQALTIGLVAWVLRQVHCINGSVKELKEWKRGHERLHDYLDKK